MQHIKAALTWYTTKEERKQMNVEILKFDPFWCEDIAAIHSCFTPYVRIYKSVLSF